jgi:tetratricopeptide (TPR) repeat protein/DNA-binding CsgD family transcriptional regulator
MIFILRFLLFSFFSMLVAFVQAQSNREVFIDARKNFTKAEISEDTLHLVQSQIQLGDYFLGIGEFEMAIEHYENAETWYSSKNQDSLAQLYSSIGHAYTQLADTSLSHSYLQKALAILEKSNNPKALASTYGKIGHYFEKKSDYQQALNFQEKALSIYTTIHDTLGIGIIYENIGSIYEDRGEFQKAKTFFLKSEEIFSKKKMYFDLANIYNNIGDIHRKTGNYGLGIQYTHKALALSRKHQIKNLEKSAYRDLAKAYGLQGLTDSSLIYLEKAYQLTDELYSEEKAVQAAKHRVIFETERNEQTLVRRNNEFKLLEKQHSLSQTLQWTFLSALFIIGAIAIYTFRLQRQRIRNNHLIIKQKEALHQERLRSATIEEERLKVELDNKTLRERYLNEQLDLRSNELTSLTLKIVSKNKLLNELREQIKSPPSEDKEMELHDIIERHLRIDKNWESFLDTFEKVHEDFFRRLMALEANLSPAEIRLCCLLKLNLPSKDIAAILSISPDSLRIARYRLRKKLNLDAKANLNTFLLQV